MPDEGAAVDAFNAMAERCGLPAVQRLTDTRRAKLRKRLAECGGVDAWRNIVIPKLESATWMHGDNDRGWKADFDFLLQEKSFTKLMEGAYDRAGNGNGFDLERAARDDCKAIASALSGELGSLGINTPGGD